MARSRPLLKMWSPSILSSTYNIICRRFYISFKTIIQTNNSIMYIHIGPARQLWYNRNLVIYSNYWPNAVTRWYCRRGSGVGDFEKKKCLGPPPIFILVSMKKIIWIKPKHLPPPPSNINWLLLTIVFYIFRHTIKSSWVIRNWLETFILPPLP